ncbi:MAG: COX15/CtaA family protein [Burkholderiaceae bacterium]|nr:COX15/CtaA family protein [Burkholderiaceae bacterium]
MNPPAYDLGPVPTLALVGAVLAMVPVLWVGWCHRRSDAPQRRRALTLITLFLTFDLVLFGAFTRLTDSGLGCPDWPGCYGSVSPLGAHEAIGAAQSAMPTGPVTHGKAWIEMIHRYLATGVGALITWLAVAAWLDARKRRRAGASATLSPWWPTLTWVWVCAQGAFGALTVTMKLYPAIVTLHLLGGLGLLALLSAQSQAPQPPLAMPRSLYRGAVVVFVVSVMQIALGGWVSTNYAVLACTDFPTCQGVWWPRMDFEHGFTVARELGAGKDGGYLPFAALTAIHMTHRMGAAVAVIAIGLLTWRLRVAGHPALRRWAGALGAVVAWQVLSGLSNVVLGWPLVAAVAHTGGAAALVVVLTMLLSRARRSQLPSFASPRSPAGTAGVPS